MNILVTGGAGYVGSHTVRLLSKSSHNVIVIDDLSTGHEWAISSEISLFKCNLTNLDKLNSIFELNDIDAVIHFAAKSIVSESRENPIQYFDNNIIGSINLFKTMIKHDVKSLVFSSTASVYGNPISDLISEDHPLEPISVYGLSKLMIEKILRELFITYNLKSVSLRYFNAAGADSDGTIGEQHPNETHLIPNAINSIISNKNHNSFKIFGNNYKTKDGTCIRDYVHVNDLATAHLKGLNYLLKNSVCEAINLGSGKGYSILEVIKEIESISQKKIDREFFPPREGDPPILTADIKKARIILNWEPQFSSLSRIIKDAYNWHKNSHKITSTNN